MNRTPALLATAAFAAAIVPAQQINVALVAAESTTGCQTTDVQTRLLATGLFANVGIINTTTAGGGTPTLAQLQAFDSVIVWTNSTPASNVALGDVLADYVDAGGGVVVAVFANSTTTAGRNIAGRWQNAYEVIMDQGGNSSGAGGTLGTVHVPSHPIMNGVTAFTGGSVGSRPNSTALAAGATLIAEWNNGKVLVAVGSNPQRVDLGFFPPHSTCSGSGWTTGGDQLMANALVHAARGASWTPFGSGCPGTAGVPTLSAGSTRPQIGGTLTLTAGNLPLGVGFVTMGFSSTNAPPFTLPLDLGLFGMPGCNLLSEPLSNTLVIGPGTSANWSLALPNNPAFVGASFYNQALSLDPPVNAAGLTVSNAGRGRAGL